MSLGNYAGVGVHKIGSCCRILRVSEFISVRIGQERKQVTANGGGVVLVVNRPVFEPRCRSLLSALGDTVWR